MGHGTPSTREEAGRELISQIVLAREFPSIGAYDCHGYRAVNMLAPPRDHHVISVCLHDAAHVRQERAGRSSSSPALRGESFLMPAGLESLWHGEIPSHIRIAVPGVALGEAAYARGVSDRVDVKLTNEFRLSDRFLRDIALLLRNEVHQPAHPAQNLVTDGLALALVGHLLGHYSSLRDPPPARTPSGTRPGVRRALEYLHANPAAKLSLEDLALAAGLSKHHFARSFRAETGLPPASYVERLRIEHAKQQLRTDSDATVAEIAYQLGFADHSHFTRRFRKHVGVTPSAFRRRARPESKIGPNRKTIQD